LNITLKCRLNEWGVNISSQKLCVLVNDYQKKINDVVKYRQIGEREIPICTENKNKKAHRS
jgi:hypothetical protein